MMVKETKVYCARIQMDLNLHYLPKRSNDVRIQTVLCPMVTAPSLPVRHSPLLVTRCANLRNPSTPGTPDYDRYRNIIVRIRSTSGTFLSENHKIICKINGNYF
jgi:hypothetical protein